ncbi:MAG: Trk family potassium uptake protein [Dehalococcoidia bacterium]|nr:Trk family potassium uptake protein [Dehalococcoidia bacterium]
MRSGSGLGHRSLTSGPPARGPWKLSLEQAQSRRQFLLSPLALVCVFVLLILLGALLLRLPLCTVDGGRTTFLDALFTATSAVCVTGLVVVDTGTHWTWFGQFVVLALIQVGGFGFMTSTTLLLRLFGRRIGLRERLLVGETIAVSSPGGLIRTIRNMALLTLVVEGVGALVLLVRFGQMDGMPRGLWTALFQSVSAFNNAGFDVFGDFVSLINLRGDAVVVITTALLLIVGGLSYVVLADIYRQRRFIWLALDSKLVLVTTGVLLFGAMLVYAQFEAANPATLAAMPVRERLLSVAFQATTPRTAGFTTVNMSDMTDYSLLFTMFLMFVGGAAGSTAGGIKVNTFGLLAATVVSTLRGRTQVSAYGRAFNTEHVHRALTVAVLALMFVSVTTLLLAVTEEADILSLAFEAVSAFGTVGLSTGITPGLTDAGRLIVIVTMFVGRLGPLYIALALVQRQRVRDFRYPVEPVRIG